MKKNKLWLYVLLTVFAAATVFNGCDFLNPIIDDWWIGPSSRNVAIKVYTVTFDMNGGKYYDANLPSPHTATSIQPQIVAYGKASVHEPGLVIIDDVAPWGEHDTTPTTKYFAGWYWYPDYTNTAVGGEKWNFNTTKVTSSRENVPLANKDEFGDIRLIAKWEDSGFIVTFAPGGYIENNNPVNVTWGQTTYQPKPEYVAPNTELSQPAGFGSTGPLAQEYIFTGWYYYDPDPENGDPGPGIVNSDYKKWDFNKPVTGNMILYAGWGKIDGNRVIQPETERPIPVYTVWFDGRGADTTPLPEKVLRGNRVPAPNAVHRDKYVFTGWFKDSALTIPWDFSRDTVTSNITLYAGWDPEPYTELWFNKYYIRANPNNMLYFPFQCDTGAADYKNVSDLDDRARNQLNEDSVVSLLKRSSGNIARIIGYKDAAANANSLVTSREDQTWINLFDRGGIQPEQLIRNNKLPPGQSRTRDEMIIGPNEDYEVKDNDEVRIIIYLPM